MNFKTVALLAVALAATFYFADATEVSFDRDIRPLLSDNCFHCHGPDSQERKAKLRLDTRSGALADLGGYSSVAPGDPAKSELFLRISSDDPEEKMPPHDSNRKLSKKEIDLLKQWILNFLVSGSLLLRSRVVRQLCHVVVLQLLLESQNNLTLDILHHFLLELLV